MILRNAQRPCSTRRPATYPPRRVRVLGSTLSLGLSLGLPLALPLGLLVGLPVAGCSNSPPPPPETYINATIGPARDSNNNNLCTYGSAKSALQIGQVAAGSATTGSMGPIPQADGSSQAGAPVNVLCTVAGGFQVSLTARLGAAGSSAGGGLSVNGHIDVDNGGTNVSASLSAPDTGGGFSSSACTVTFRYAGGSVPVSPPIAGGRVWAHLSCPTMTSTDLMVVMIGSTQVTEQCDVEADFLFENCSQ